jgi:hypothetical protein
MKSKTINLLVYNKYSFFYLLVKNTNGNLDGLVAKLSKIKS